MEVTTRKEYLNALWNLFIEWPNSSRFEDRNLGMIIFHYMDSFY